MDRRFIIYYREFFIFASLSLDHSYLGEQYLTAFRTWWREIRWERGGREEQCTMQMPSYS